MNPIHELPVTTWNGPFGEPLRREAVDALENGEVLFLPNLAFALTGNEQPLLSPTLSDGKSKNISLSPNGRLKNTSSSQAQHEMMQAMMQRFAQGAVHLIEDLFPQYATRLERARTSYRPVEIAGRKASVLHDDTRLHIDAFPTRPMKRGRRILRLFSNVNPNGQPRVWHVGEPFPDMAAKILPKVSLPSRAKNLLLAASLTTRGVRSGYDSYMHGLHDQAKLDESYQANCPQIEFAFPPGCTWMCYTDQVMHAALSGQFVLEQTFHLDLDAMTFPERAPFNVLERLTGASLA
ncbi:MAG TPA: Kdo hydroxylase family protein [Rhizomicrobium sp.]|jgi:hypothetical protein|nr:Kdo hydroxylase family protein [Rhizomicrobium sp.]